MEASRCVKSTSGSEMTLHDNGFQVGMLSCYQHSANNKINATGVDLISNQGMLYVLIHALGRWANCFYIRIIHRIFARIWHVVQEELTTDASQHSSLTVRADASEQPIR